jgi:hypothetical protein
MDAPTFQLTPTETELLGKIKFEARTHDELRWSCSAASELTRLLIERRVIPEIRTRYFTEPEFNIGSKKSRQQVFESNGTVRRAIFSHPHFLPYLRYFIFGPNLPTSVVVKYHDLAMASSYISGSDMPELLDVAKGAVRRFKLDPKAAAEEFFKLTLECGGDSGSARIIRDSVIRLKLGNGMKLSCA